MGIELERFVHTIDDELKCSICCGVLESPIQLTECEHTFCSQCIQEWIKRQSKCPIDRREITNDSLRPASRLLNSFLSRLQLRCDFLNLGCNAIISFESLTSHTNECHFNPDKVFPCDKGCGVLLSSQQKVDHNCVLEDILINIENQNERIRKLEKIIEKQNKVFEKRIEDLEQKCLMSDVLQSKYQLIENKYNDLIQKLTSLGITAIPQIGEISNKSETQVIPQKEIRIERIGRTPKSDTSPMRIINIEIDYKKQTIEMWANIKEPIKNIKLKIKVLENLSIESQCLFGGNQLLFDEKCLDYYYLNSMDLVLVKRPITVDIILFNGNISFVLEPFDTISRLRDKIFNSKGFNVKLTYFGQMLDECRTFHSYKIRDRAKLKVIAIECNTDGCFGSQIK